MSKPDIKVRLNSDQICMIQEAIAHFPKDSMHGYSESDQYALRSAEGILQGCWEAVVRVENTMKEYEIEF